jgi:hypothetical protein
VTQEILLASCRNIPEESTIYAQPVNMGSQRHLKISRLYYASNAIEHGPACCHDKAHFPISCWQYDGACFSSRPTSRDVAFGCLPERLSICLFPVLLVVYVSLALCLRHTHHFIYNILSSLYLDVLFHFIRFILKTLVVSLCTYVGVNWFSWPIKAWRVKKICLFSSYIWWGGGGAPHILKLPAGW